MALNTLVRRSASSVTPFAARLLGGQTNLNHPCGGALFTAVNHTRKIISDNSFLVPSVSKKKSKKMWDSPVELEVENSFIALKQNR
ncbi:hypothetical protein L2E82_33808 [Cichorium intybus]|uniref:Uncharacterized protein n=1 Tax=Cichorium intybus TaxID=13427 RepID=A0ACB9BL54_CICIN|nr:hypothetical protein L2E82_33808 [Cichorium intybus]